MTNDEVMQLDGFNNPVLLADGKIGMLLIYPTTGKCGVQVHGEDEHRWVDSSELRASAGGALRQTGAPTAPQAKAQCSFQDMLLMMDWVDRGGANIPTEIP